jgi:Holliday junction resolvase-like predicted endonuclease
MSESIAPADPWATPSERALDCASDHLEQLGYRVLARRFHDADLIAGRWPLVLACQVRACRVSAPAHDEASPPARRLRLAASEWLARAGNQGFHQLRFDSIDVYLAAGGELVGLEHVPNAF